MKLDGFISEGSDRIFISATKASHFAKSVAGDFNPLHNVESRKFCVPGDLLFALVLKRYGLSTSMRFDFINMLRDSVPVKFISCQRQIIKITDDNGKIYLSVNAHGEPERNESLIDALTREYVAFSGHIFPDILIPLMEEQRIMVNPERPLIIYKHMRLNIHASTTSRISLVLTDTSLDLDGKRGAVTLKFDIKSKDDNRETVIGNGEKHLVIGGLIPFNKQLVNVMISEFRQYQQQHKELNHTKHSGTC